MLGQRKSFLLLVSFLFFLEAAAQAVEPAVTISVNAIPGLQYDRVRFNVKPGAEVKLILTNNDDMSHNLVITLPGAREEVVNAALQLGDQGVKMQFVPNSPKVLWSIAVLAPGETKSLTFTAPKESGVYPYVCTYPGHGFIMYGAMYVTNEAMPPIQQDLNIPVIRRTAEANDKISSQNSANKQEHDAHVSSGKQAAHPYELVAPYFYRVFIADAGPAAIAVCLPNQISYCWDAGSCRLRYAWQGEFLDNTDFWKGHKDANAKVLGEIFYRDKTDFPLRIGTYDDIPVAKFKGYRLVNRYPEFHYSLNGIDVYELLRPKADGSGLIRSFRIPKADQPIWFTFDPEDGVDYSTSKGKLIKTKIKLSPREVRQFSVTMTKKGGFEL